MIDNEGLIHNALDRLPATTPATASNVGAATPTAALPTAGAQAAPAAAAAPAQGAAASTPAKPPAPGTSAQPHNWGRRVLGSILAGLGGSEEVSYARDPQTGEMVATRTKSGPGQQWKRIIASGLMGAVAGAAVKPGPGQIGRAAQAGMQSGMGLATSIDDKKRAHADEDFEMQQQTTVRKAQLAKLNQDISIGAFQLTTAKAAAAYNESDRENEFNKSIQGGGAGSRDLGVFKSFEDLLHGSDNIPNLLQEQAHGNIIGVPHVENGQITGMHYAMVTPQWKDGKLTSDQTFYSLVPGANGKPPTVDKQTVKAGTMSQGEFWTKQQAASKEIIDFQKKQMELTSEEKRTGMTAGATVQAAKIGADSRRDVASILGKSREAVASTKAAMQGAGLTSATRTMMETAPKVKALANKVLAALDKNADQLGPLEGRWSEFMAGKIGSDNPEFIKLRTDGKLLTTLLMRMHVGARGGSQMMQHFNSLLDTGKQSPDNLRAALESIISYADDVAHMPGEGAAPAAGASKGAFSASAWQKANPSGDVEAAKAAAKAQGYEVRE